MSVTEAQSLTPDERVRDGEGRGERESGVVPCQRASHVMGEEEDTTTTKEVEEKVVKKEDMAAVKHALDEIVADIVTSDCGYPENFTASNVRMALSFVACLMAPASHFLPPYLEKHEKIEAKSKNAVVLACVVIYAIFFTALALFQYLYEKEAILFTGPKQSGAGAPSAFGLRVSTGMEKFDDVYKVTLAPVFASGNTAVAATGGGGEFSLEKSVTKWIDTDGVIAEDVVKRDVKRFVQAFEKRVGKTKRK